MKTEYQVVRCQNLHNLKAEVNLYLAGGGWRLAGGLAISTSYQGTKYYQAVVRRVNEHGIGVDADSYRMGSKE